MKLLDNFLRYVKIDTQASYNSTTIPSSASQLSFLEMLEKELHSLGLSDIEISNNSVLFATIPPSQNIDSEDIIGLIAHVDTSPDAPSKNICPLVHENYDGGDIILPHTTISVAEYPELADFVNDTLITSDGSTLLGADDKAGVAIIVSFADFLIKNPTIPHSKIRLAFTTDEEIGSSIDNFDIAKFGVDYAYTLDAGGYALLEFENFNACSVDVKITGKNIHPGYAYHKMINACDLAFEFHSMVPQSEKPVTTQDREGFYHLNEFSGDVASAKLHYIIRDFDLVNFENRKTVLQTIAENINKRYPNSIALNISDSYFNMRNYIPNPIIERARKAFLSVGITPIEHPIRGGTDGARLSQLGVPTPNLFNGGMNFHSKHEYCSLNAMEKAVEMLIELVKTDTKSSH